MKDTILYRIYALGLIVISLGLLSPIGIIILELADIIDNQK